VPLPPAAIEDEAVMVDDGAPQPCTDTVACRLSIVHVPLPTRTQNVPDVLTCVVSVLEVCPDKSEDAPETT
jgi:hypothetical protein